ncbi:MAG: FAD-binding oxidoreductase [Synechococcus sp. BS301-5m-G54]|nr:FAD-binding oxidoreductase [Synechococcus sp. BS301-5m-G54]MBL6796650.1 FAD-binding oxidoreductase [Synechococcus sp. BS307-5m-G34]
MPPSPATRKELIALVRQWHDAASPWIPSGLGTRLDWGPPLDARHPVLSCRGLNRVIDHAVDDLTITVQAGCPLADLQAVLAERGQWLPLDHPRGEAEGSIGGLVARGLAGGLRQRHLGVRDQIIGITLLRSDGVEARAGGRVVKNVAGYDLMKLLCGSWGSLALITELTLRVQPIRPAHATLLLNGDLSSQNSFRAELLRSTLTPERCDWQSRGDGHWQLRLLLSSVSDQAVEDQMKRLEAMAGSHRLKTQRHSGADPLDSGLPCMDPTWLVRVALPSAVLHQLLSDGTLLALKGWQWDLAAGAGCGDGWCSEPTAPYRVDALRRRVIDLGGQLTVLKQPLAAGLPAWLDAPARPVIEAVKRQFDPRQQLCRGRLPGVDQETA